jgi:hypothetical protein
VNLPTRRVREIFVMRYNDYRCSIGIELFEQRDNLGPGARVELTCRLVSEQ